MEKPENHIGLVYSVCKLFLRRREYHGPYADTEEFSDGCLALVKACNKYVPRTDGVKFVTYAWWCVFYRIRQGIIARHTKASKMNYGDPIEELLPPKQEWLEEAELESKVWKAIQTELDSANKVDNVRHSGLNLSYKERAAIIGRLQRRTLQDLADELGCTKQRVEQTYRRGTTKLAESLLLRGVIDEEDLSTEMQIQILGQAVN